MTTVSSTTAQDYQYPLDSIATSLVMTGLQSGSEIRIYRSSDGFELGGTESSGTSFTYNYTWEQDVNVDVVIHHINYEYIKIPNLTLISSGISIPVQQKQDRWYNNPA